MMPPMPALSRPDLARLDEEDELAWVRDEFTLPEGIVYLDGNSLGPLPRRTVERVRAVTEDEWGRGLIRSWNDHGWIDLPGTGRGRAGPAPGRVGGRGGRGRLHVRQPVQAPLRGRAPAARVAAVILSEKGNFPTDLYVAQGLAGMLEGIELRLVEREDVPAALDETVAVLMLTHVDFRTGALHDMEALTAAAHEAGALALWDLSHSAGAVPLALDAWGVDLAVGCGYKYLNGGTGRAGLCLRRAAPSRGLRHPAAGVDGPRRAVRLRDRVPTGPGDRPAPLRDASHPEPGRAGVWRRDRGPGRGRPAPPQVGAADRPLRPPRRAGVLRARSRPGFSSRRRRSGAARSPTGTPRPMPSCRP